MNEPIETHPFQEASESLPEESFQLDGARRFDSVLSGESANVLAQLERELQPGNRDPATLQSLLGEYAAELREDIQAQQPRSGQKSLASGSSSTMARAFYHLFYGRLIESASATEGSDHAAETIRQLNAEAEEGVTVYQKAVAEAPLGVGMEGQEVAHNLHGILKNLIPEINWDDFEHGLDRAGALPSKTQPSHP